jgi:hypothetical protein
MSDAPAPDIAPTPDAPETPTPDTGDVDLAAEVEKWKAASRKHEDRAKANAKAAQELDEFRRQSMTDQEKAVADAVTAARAEAFAEVGTKVAAAELRAAAAGRMGDEQIEVLLEGLNLARFLGDTGDVDRDAVRTFVDSIAPADQQPTRFDIGQGARSGGHKPLNGDPLLEDLRRVVGAPRQRG